MKKFIVSLSVVMIFLILCSCTSNLITNEPTMVATENEVISETEAIQTPAPDPTVMPVDEIERAIWYGFVPENMHSDLDSQILLSEYVTMLSNMMGKINKNLLPRWNEVSSQAAQLDKKISRDEGMVTLFYAADSMGVTKLDGWDANWGEISQSMHLEDTKFVWDYYYFNGWDQFYPGGWEGQQYNYIIAGDMFSIGKTSKVSHKSLLDYDPATNSMREADPFTRREAILSVVRLYESAEFSTNLPVTEVIPLTISQETIALASQMPEATNKALPQWYGSTMDNMSATWNDDGSVGILYWEKDVQDLANLGINFLRVPLDDRFIFSGDNFEFVNQAALQNIDNLITWGIENKIHICLDLHSTPGFTTNADDSDDSMFSDEHQQQLFTKFWSYMADRYKGIPNNALSFNLLNEPHGELQENTYVSVMKTAIDEIRKYSPDRLIFVDMLDTAKTPIYSLVESGVAQSTHMYIQGLTNLISENSNFDLEKAWPIYLINGFIHKDVGPFVLTGNFKTGTSLEFRISGFHSTGKIVVEGDGKKIGSYDFGTEQVGENNCTEISEQGTPGEWRRYNGAGFTIQITEDTQKISLYPAGNSFWFSIQGISVLKGDDSLLIVANNDLVAKNNVGVVLNIAEDNTVSAQDPETLSSFDENAFANQLKKYKDFSIETGIPVMVQEFGYDSSTDYALTLKVLDAQIAAFDHYGFGWCMWSGTFNFLAENDQQKRDGATYEQIGDNRWVAKEMIDVMHKYMEK